MSQENVDRLRVAYQGLAIPEVVREVVTAGDGAGLVAPDFELHQTPGVIGTTGVFRGPDAFRESLREVQEAFDDLSFEAERFLEAPGGEVVVFVHVRTRGRGSGIETDARIAHVWTFRDDKAVRMVVFTERAEALEAVGLSEQDAHADS